MNKMQEQIIEIIKKSLKGIGVGEEMEVELSAPPKLEFGDFAFGCFPLAKILGKSPVEIAKQLAEEIRGSGVINKDVKNTKEDKNAKNLHQPKFIEEIQVAGPYINFKINRKQLFGEIYKKIILDKNYLQDLKINIENKKKVMVEYLSPNTNKPLHLGHLRNGTLSMAVSNILEANGNEVIKANLINDRGVHICKSMLAWKLFGNGETPESTGIKGDHFVGKYYVKFSQEAEKNPELEAQAQEMLQKWEEGDKEILKLWKMMNKWVIDGFNESFKTLGFKFDVIYKESKTYKLGKNIIAKGLKKGVFQKEKNGAVVFILPDSFGLDEEGNNKKVTVLRKDGTSVYITQDLGTAVLKAEEYNLDQSIYVVGSEQEYYFRSLFEILKALNYAWSKNNFHLSYGMVYLPDGRMKSREGKIVDADDLVIKIKDLAKQGILERRGNNLLEEKELEKRAMKISLGAIKFYLLKVNPTQDIIFDTKESLSFEGFTGPYCQYSYARASKLLRDAQIKKDEKIKADFSILGSKEEIQLVHKILESNEKIKLAGENFNPSLVAIHIFELAKTFNQFYHSKNILKAKKNIKLARLALVQMFLQIIKTELNLLGIDVLDEM